MFQSKEHIQIPNKDILSWYFDDPFPSKNKPIYIDANNPDRFYSHRTAHSTIRQLVAGFRQLGLQAGDCVCILAFNDIDYPILVNGIVAFGGIYSGINPAYQVFEIKHAIHTANIKAFVVEPSLLKNVLKATDDTGLCRERILVFDHSEGESIPTGFESWRSLLKHGDADWIRFDDESTASSTPAARLFSSGTTGLPKAATLSHQNFIAQHCQVNEWRPKRYEERRLLPLPMFHVATAPIMHFSPLKNGVTTFVMQRFELERYLGNIERYKITDMALVPPMIVAIVASDKKYEYDLSSVVFATSGAAPLDRGLQARMRELLRADAKLTQVWGMTETTCIATNFPYPEDDDTGSVGRPLPGIDLKLVDDDGRDITNFDVRGELCIRGPTVIRGYMDEKATTESWDEDGFFHTGDVAYCDQQYQKWYIVDRKKDLIKVRGFQVAPPELEAALLSHESIADAAVIGVTFSGDSSEYPRAYLVRRYGVKESEVNAESMSAYMSTRLAKYKQLDGGCVFVDTIPRNASGKILKNVLRDQARKEIAKEKSCSRL